MSSTLPPFGWPIPEDTDPLADGAAAMRMLAAAIAGTLSAASVSVPAVSPWTSGTGLTMGRVGKTVVATLNAQRADPVTIDGGWTLATVPANYRPAADTFAVVATTFGTASEAVPATLLLFPTGTLQVGSRLTNVRALRGTLTWLTP